MSKVINIWGTVDAANYKTVDSLYGIIEELVIGGMDGICFSLHTDKYTNLAPFSVEEWKGIKNYCEALNIEFIGRPRALRAVECLEQIGVERYRISAEEVGNFPLLEVAARTGKELIISALPGMDWQLERMIDFVQPYDNDLVLMQWMPDCPCEPWDWGLHRLSWLKSHFGYKVGLSDRSGDVFATSAAIALGAEHIEFRISDYSAEQRKRLVEAIRKVELSLKAQPVNDDYLSTVSCRNLFERSLIFNKDKRKGMQITIDDIEVINSGDGIDVSRYYDIIGKYLGQDVKKGEMLRWPLLQHDRELN